MIIYDNNCEPVTYGGFKLQHMEAFTEASNQGDDVASASVCVYCAGAFIYRRDLFIELWMIT